ncbi:MAG: MFS transporter, partial [Desulfobacterales bacterium]
MPTSRTTLDIPALSDENTAFKVLGAIGFSHFLNDMIQSLLPAIYPLLKSSFALSFTQIGLITLTFQITASLLQPMVGLYTDHHPKPYSLSIGMGCTLIGLIILAFAPGYGILLIAAAMVGTGSSIFHPESSRVARMASGGRYGLAQSIFQVGGNAGSATGPLLAAFIVIPHGRNSIAWFSLAALLAMLVLWQVGGWYKSKQSGAKRPGKSQFSQQRLPSRTVIGAMLVLMVLIFSKFFYLA